jgi:hypothetical protein
MAIADGAITIVAAGLFFGPKIETDPRIAVVDNKPQFLFDVFRPKNACQAPKRPNQLIFSNIALAY